MSAAAKDGAEEQSQALRDKLRRLLRAPQPKEERMPESAAEPAPVALGPPVAGRSLPAWLLEHLAAQPGAGQATRLGFGEPEGLLHGASALGEWYARETQLAQHSAHGDWRLDEAQAAKPEALALVALDEALLDFEPRQALFLDIETNGLAGGAGSYSFLVALAQFTPGGLRVWQGFLRHPGEERALLLECAERIAEARTLVSFFGKSFDRHRLEDKMRCFGITPPFQGRAHLDLYWPCRRLYGAALCNGRLATMERALCGVEREGDLCGALAPAAWFDFLAGRSHRLEGVFKHNLEDVLSLVTLTAHLGRCLEECRADGRPLSGSALERAKGLAKLYRRSRQRAPAQLWSERALERGAGGTGV